MANSLHPKLLVGLLAALLAASASAQYTGHAKESRMRAVGILRVDPVGKARLFPVSLFADGKYYDARFYQANPVPFAIDGDVFYQVEQDGAAVGNFVVRTAMHNSFRWWAEGLWTPGSGKSAGQPSAGGQSGEPHRNDDRPVLRRAPSASADSSAADKSGSHDAKTAAPRDDAAEQAEARDPNRPTLHHGKSEQVQAEVPKSGPGVGVAAAAPPPYSANDKVLLAVADLGNIESRSYSYKASAEERQHDLEALKSMASDAIRKAAKERASLRGVDAGNLNEVELHLLDPDYSNRPLEILTATITPSRKFWLPPGSIIKAPPKMTVVVVARKDSTQRLNQISLMIADLDMLDVRPSLEYLGAVDADGSGRAQLLFRKQVDVNSFGYVLYRATPYELIKTFETKATEE